MSEKKKAAIVIYPQFSNYEISIISAIFRAFAKEIIVFSADRSVVDSEEGFHFIPDKTLSEFVLEDYDCLILPGMWCFPDVLKDSRYIDFFTQFKDKNGIVIGSISSSPILLAKAGVLNGRKFCAGLFEEDIDHYDFINKENIIRAPLVIDRNIITAMGSAYREFAIEIGRKLNFNCGEEWFSGIRKPIRSEDYIFYRNHK
ncbi:DJ-1/PfpI family protein [Clostridium manihotivorum]|uniref:DJ-1/PfpI family protein n=1 Tax=Clostridium manihotivorum TaxID=2320868 RepID=A0A3R5TFY0_9CLOT|nr:DJ-1/PfpI family protein [Clostridium manihotivorum]QAA32528.1 DJ-1/PfpI family protein [Clostridium manihotivorum]